MKLGPVHVVTDATMVEMQRLIHRPCEVPRPVEPPPTGPSRVPASEHFLHRLSPDDASFPVVAVPDDADDTRGREATRRVLAAYRRARADAVPTDRGVWDLLAANNPAFFAALDDGDVGAVRERLARFLRDDVSWGLGFFTGETPTPVARDLAAAGVGPDRVVADLLLSFAEAAGVARLTSPEQDPAAHARPLAGYFVELMSRLVGTIGVNVTHPAVAGVGAFRVAGELVTVDSLTHAYTLWRLRELGVGPNSRLLEIGGGYGGLAELAFRTGIPHVTVVDLPWVNVLQGYYLLMTCPPEAVTLYGEPSDGCVRVVPDTAFRHFGSASFDAVVNTNSLPEMPPAVAGDYVRGVRRVLDDGPFLSINQEAKQQIADLAPLNCVAELVAAVGGYRRASRQRAWLRPGYVEEVYYPRRS